MKTTVKTIVSLALGACLVGNVAGCADQDLKPDESDVKGGPDGKAEAWGSSDNPALFNSNLEYVAANLPAQGEATKIPWAGNYWPVYEDSINHKWAGPNSKAASTKYGEAFGVTGMPTSFLVDRDGVVRMVHMGFRDGDIAGIEAAISALLD